MSRDLRAMLNKQDVHDKDIDKAKHNLLAVGHKLGSVYTQQHEIIDALDFNSSEVQDLCQKVKEAYKLCTSMDKKQADFMDA